METVLFLGFCFGALKCLVLVCFWGQLNLGIYLNDTETDVSVLVDRAVGGASIVDGQLEIMLHRYTPSPTFVIYELVFRRVPICTFLCPTKYNSQVRP